MLNQEINVEEILNRLSRDGRGLFISMAHFAWTGGKLDAIEATSELSGDRLKKAMRELEDMNLGTRGKVILKKMTKDELRELEKSHGGDTKSAGALLGNFMSEILFDRIADANGVAEVPSDFEPDKTGDRFRIDPVYAKAINDLYGKRP